MEILDKDYKASDGTLYRIIKDNRLFTLYRQLPNERIFKTMSVAALVPELMLTTAEELAGCTLTPVDRKKPAQPIETPKPAAIKRNYEKTLDEYAAERALKMFKSTPTEMQVRGNRFWAQFEHGNFIKQAISEGKDISAEVLADYPLFAELSEETKLRLNSQIQ